MEQPDRPDRMPAFYDYLWPEADDYAARMEILDAPPLAPEPDFVAAAFGATRLPHGARVLDIGCGRGGNAARLAQEFGCEVIGADYLARNLAQARRRVEREEADVALIAADILRLPFRASTFDLVWCSDMLNHIANAATALRECARVLRPGGAAVLTLSLQVGAVPHEDLDRMCASMGFAMESVDTERLAAAIEQSGLAVEWFDSFDDAESPFHFPVTEDWGQEVVRLARLLREPERYGRLLGEAAIEPMIGHHLYNAYILLGKLSYHFILLRKES
jgi:SAM-dependent methyltransferase